MKVLFCVLYEEKSKEMSENVKMIKCHNCGANYPITEKICPYCSAENKALAESEFQSQIASKYAQIEKERTKPQRFVDAIKKYIVFIIIAIVVLVSAAFAVYSFKKEKPAQTYEVSEEYIDELEAAVAAKDYKKVSTIVFDNNLYNGHYEAYYRLADVYDEYESVMDYEGRAYNDASPNEVFLSEENRVYSVSICARVSIEHCLRVLWKGNDYLAENTFFGTEDNIAEIVDEVYSKLDHWNIDRATVDELLADYIENGSSTEDDESLISKCGEKAAEIIMAEVK